MGNKTCFSRVHKSDVFLRTIEFKIEILEFKIEIHTHICIFLPITHIFCNMGWNINEMLLAFLSSPNFMRILAMSNVYGM